MKTNLERIKQAKPFVVVCPGCGKIRKFGKFVNMFVPMEKLMQEYEVISVACDECQMELYQNKESPLYP